LAPNLINVKKCDYHMAYDTITKYHSITANWQYRDKQMVLEWPDDTSDLKIICDNIITSHYIQTEHNWSHTYHNIIQTKKFKNPKNKWSTINSTKTMDNEILSI
jgi:hypothetical protein